MPYTTSKHRETEVVELSNFTGGINAGIPPTQIKDNECTVINNMFFDRKSGRLRTRYPITRWSNSATTNTTIWGIYFWKGVWIVVDKAGTVYYLDDSKDPQSIGTLSGINRPSFQPFNDKLVIASGGLLQYTAMYGSVPQALETMPDAPNATYLMQKYSRLVSSGDSNHPDRIHESAYADESTWSSGSEDYADVGFKDDTEVVGITEAFEGMYFVFKRGYGGLKTYFLTSLSETSPVSRLVTDGHAPVSHAGVVHAMGKLFLMEESFVSAIAGTDQRGKVQYDQTPGLKLSNAFDANSLGHCVLYPRDAQIWFIPNPGVEEAFIYHYHMNAWTRFNFDAVQIFSTFYDPVSQLLYLGANDGYVYLYNRTTATYLDTAGSYTSQLITKMFTQGNREMVVKNPRLVFLTLKAGAGTMSLVTGYGQTTVSWGTITTTTPQDYVYDTRAAGSAVTYVYDTRAGAAGEQYAWAEDTYAEQKGDYNQPTESYQFDLKLTSGAFIIERLVTEVSAGRRA